MDTPHSPPRAPAATRTRRRWRRLRAVAVGVLLAAGLIELTLQVASYVAWRRESGGDRPPGRVLLCIGDSLTFGLGAAPPEAYPSRLQGLLAERGAAWSVVNAGIPGNCSADVLHRLPRLLESLRPEAVCLLVGWNDSWARPAPLARAELDAGGFPLRWRTARLLSLLFARTDALVPVDERPFLGAWRVLDQEFWFGADGTARLGPLPATWRVEQDVLHITPDGGETFPLRWRMAERSLEFALFGWSRYERARRGAAAEHADVDRVGDLVHRAQLAEALAIVGTGDGDATTTAMRARIVTELLRPECRVDLAPLRTALEQSVVEPLQRAWQRDRDATAGQALAGWLLRAGRREPAIEIARALLQGHDDRVPCWRILIDTSAPAERARLAVELTAVIARLDSPWRRAELQLERAIALADHDPDGALAALLLARAGGIGPDETIAGMARAVALGADRDRLRGAAAAVALPEHQRTALLADLRRALVDDREMYDVLARHVTLAVEAVRANGARVFLLGYPFAMPEHEACMRRVAAELDVPFVSMVDRFAALLHDAPREHWFVDDIHCSAAGYAQMARCAADDLGDALR